MLRLPNRTAQYGTYHTSATDYLDPSGAARPGMRSFSTTATDDSWEDGDTVALLVLKDNTHWIVGTFEYASATGYLSLVSTETSENGLSDTDAVMIVAAPTSETLQEVLISPPSVSLNTVENTTGNITSADAGKVVRCTSSSAVTLTASTDLPTGFHCMIVQEGTGLVSVAAGSGTINGGSTSVPLAGRYTSGYLYKPTSETLVVIA